MRGHILVLDAGDVALTARHIRDLAAADLADISSVDLDRAAQLLRAGAYSSVTAARQLERLAETRREAVA